MLEDSDSLIEVNDDPAPSATEPREGSPEAVLKFARMLGRRGHVPEATSQNFRVALSQIVSVLDDDEPRDSATLLAQIDDLAVRWASKNPEKSSGATYLQRAKKLLTEYERWRKDRLHYRPEKAKASRPAPVGAGKGKKAEPSAEAPPAAEPPKGGGASKRIVLTMPCADGDEIVISLPAGAKGLCSASTDDARRAVALIVPYLRDATGEDAMAIVSRGLRQQ